MNRSPFPDTVENYFEMEEQDVSAREVFKTVYKGVEIYRFENSRDNSGCLQCGLCGYSAEITDSTLQEDSAYQSIISHIKGSHVTASMFESRL